MYTEIKPIIQNVIQQQQQQQKWKLIHNFILGKFFETLQAYLPLDKD